MLRLAAAVLGALLLAQEGRVERGRAPGRPLRPASDPALQALLSRYEIAEKDFPWELKFLKESDRFTLGWLTFPSPVRGPVEANNTVWAKYWQPKGGGGRRPAALVLHWLGGSFDLLEVVCGKLAEEGIAALMMYMPHYGPRRAREGEGRRRLMTLDMEETLANVRQAVLDARRAGDWLASRPDVEPSRVGIVGISLGAILGSLAAGVDDRFGRSVFIIGGGDLPAIVLNGSRETAEQKRALEEAGYTADRLRALWREIEPCTFAGRIRTEEVLLINAESDEVVPRECAVRLWEAMGRPKIRWIKGGHYAILFQLGGVVKELVAHLCERTAY
jgi:dienelactone hydrolase